jgi:RNA polymerase sigma-70 factor (ECF subfamily)
LTRDEVDIGALLARARERDPDALSLLLRLCQPRLEAIIASRLGNGLRQSIETDDVLQEVLLRAVRSIETFASHDMDSFLRWLGTIAEHVILDLARRRARQEKTPLGGRQDIAATSPSESKIIRRDERFRRLQKALHSLSPDHRQVILLARIEGLPLKEVAARMKRSPAAVTQLLLRALRKLRSAFGDTESLSLPPRSLLSEPENQDDGGDGSA